jgi:hypothetical protein
MEAAQVAAEQHDGGYDLSEVGTYGDVVNCAGSATHERY